MSGWMIFTLQETGIPKRWSRVSQHHIDRKCQNLESGSPDFWNQELCRHLQIASHHVTAFQQTFFWKPTMCQTLCWASVMKKTQSLPSRHHITFPWAKASRPGFLHPGFCPLGHHQNDFLVLQALKAQPPRNNIHTPAWYCGNPFTGWVILFTHTGWYLTTGKFNLLICEDKTSYHPTNHMADLFPSLYLYSCGASHLTKCLCFLVPAVKGSV